MRRFILLACERFGGGNSRRINIPSKCVWCVCSCLLLLFGCHDSDRGKLTKLASRDLTITTVCQWFADLDADTSTGYGAAGYDVVQRPGGEWRQTGPTLFDGGWGPEIDCGAYGPNVKGLVHRYSDDGKYQTSWAEWRLITCTQGADVDQDGDIDLRDWWQSRSSLILQRMTGP